MISLSIIRSRSIAVNVKFWPTNNLLVRPPNRGTTTETTGTEGTGSANEADDEFADDELADDELAEDELALELDEGLSPCFPVHVGW